jgi:HK97 family phage major capsid protein/HK97 family phage prohead protease
MERLEFKAAFTADEAGAVEGKAWDFSSPDRVGDAIAPSAFAGAIGKSLPMLFAHDQAQVVGAWDSVTVEADGLKVKGRLLVDDVARAKEVRALLRAKAVTGLSVGFMTKKAAPRKGGGRTITDLDLVEVSIVAVPAHPGAQISNVKELPMTTAAEQTNDTNLDAKAVEALQKRLDALEAKNNRLVADAANDNDRADAETEKKALNAFLRSGVAALDPEDQKTLNIGTPASGGYVTAPEYSTTVIEKITEFSPMRRLASVMSIGTGEIYIPTLETDANGGWVTETGARPSSEPTFDQVNIKTFEHAVIVPVSQQLLEDSFIDLQSFLSAHIAKRFGKAESASFVTGDGNGKPTGFLNAPADFEQITADQDGSDLIEKLIDLYYSLPAEYAARATWAMNRKTMGLIRKAADTTTKGTLWSDSLASGQPARFLGAPVEEFPDMPDFAPAVAADTFPVAFGDFATAYQIIDRVNIQIMRDDYTGADNGIVKFRARRRVGGKVVLPEAINLLKSDAA